MRLGIDASNIRAGGGITHLANLLKHANPAANGFREVTVWSSKQTLATLPSAKPWLHLDHDPVLDQNLFHRLFWQRNRLPRLLRDSYDLLFLPGGGSVRSFKPYVTLSQNMLPFDFREMFRFGISWMLLRIFLLRLSQSNAFRNADGVIFLSHYARDTINNKVNISGSMAVIPHGIDGRFYRSPLKQRQMNCYSTRNPFRLLYVSTVNVYKHQWNVAKAVTTLRNEGLPVSLDLVGPAYPKAMKRFQSVQKRNDPDHKFIRYLGAKPHINLPELYHSADAFVFASSCENMPIILLEAMAGGLPIACSNRGPMPEVLNQEGCYFDPDKPAEITNALRTLLSDPCLREHYAEAAYAKSKTFSWERCASDTFEFLANMARSKKSG